METKIQILKNLQYIEQNQENKTQPDIQKSIFPDVSE